MQIEEDKSKHRMQALSPHPA